MSKKHRPPFAERLIQALGDGIRHNRGEITLRTTELEIPEPPPAYRAADVLRVRQQLHMSQPIFAALLHVSVKTIQSWEQGERNPSHAAARLLQTIEQPDMLPAFLARQRARGLARQVASQPSS